MSATSIPVDHSASPADSSLPLAEGNRVLESITQQKGLSALLAFSELHDRIRKHRPTAAASPDLDLCQTERFFLDEVLQLICSRALALTHADAVMIALGQADGSEMVCRASAGPLPIPRGLRLNPGSEFLQQGLTSGQTLRCDDALTDERVEFDLTQALDARSAVLVPLRGHSQRVGVLQAFSNTAWAFTDDDVRSFDLFAELILAALRPEDQDRRFHWLADIADDVLQGDQQARVRASALLPPGAQTGVEEPAVEAVLQPIETPLQIPKSTVIAWPDLTTSQPDVEDEEEWPIEMPIHGERALTRRSLEFRLHSSEDDLDGNILAAHPGLSVVMGLVAVAALFSAGVWWGMQEHGRLSTARSAVQTAATQSGRCQTSRLQCCTSVFRR